jgi:pyruvate formate lyase activating enzyme
MKVCIFDIKRFAIHDGPGIRTTVFFKGCPLECWWCHNPESISAGPELFTEEVIFDGVLLEKKVEVGRWEDVDILMNELERDRIFMDESNGGISFSGGEPLHQADALFRMLELSRERNIHTTVDTSGYTTPERMEKVCELSDLIYYDLKSMNSEKHKTYTGVPNRKILENLERTAESGTEVVVRIPVVSGFNDLDQDLEPMRDFLRGLNGLKAVDILPYHPFGTHKYKRFNKENKQNGFKTPSKDRIAEIKQMFSDSGFRTRVGG